MFRRMKELMVEGMKNLFELSCNFWKYLLFPLASMSQLGIFNEYQSMLFISDSEMRQTRRSYARVDAAGRARTPVISPRPFNTWNNTYLLAIAWEDTSLCPIQ
jgi:hypothetical protein